MAKVTDRRFSPIQVPAWLAVVLVLALWAYASHQDFVDAQAEACEGQFDPKTATCNKEGAPDGQTTEN